MSATTQHAEITRVENGLWAPGQSGNPGGRPKKLVDINAMAREYGPECVEKCVHLMRHSEDERIQFAAMKELMDRGYGKPVQALTTPDAATTITFLHLVAARAFSEQMQAGNVPVIEGNTDVSTDTNVATKPDLMQPATE